MCQWNTHHFPSVLVRYFYMIFKPDPHILYHHPVPQPLGNTEIAISMLTGEEHGLYWRPTEYVGPNSFFCCSSAMQTPLTAGVTDRQMDRQTDRHNKGALGLPVTNKTIRKLSSGFTFIVILWIRPKISMIKKNSLKLFLMFKVRNIIEEAVVPNVNKISYQSKQSIIFIFIVSNIIG